MALSFVCIRPKGLCVYLVLHWSYKERVQWRVTSVSVRVSEQPIAATGEFQFSSQCKLHVSFRPRAQCQRKLAPQSVKGLTLLRSTSVPDAARIFSVTNFVPPLV